MRILIVHCKYQDQGGEDFVVEQEAAILRCNHAVEILYFQNKTGWRGWFSMLFYPFNFFAGQKLRSTLKKIRPDVIHLHNFHYDAGPYLIRAAWASGIPVVMTLHNFRILCPTATLFYQGQAFTHSIRESFPWSAVRAGVISSSVVKTFWVSFGIWLHKHLGTFLLPKRYLALNYQQKEILSSQSHLLPAEKIYIKPNFCPDISIVHELKRHEHFLFIGRLSEEKGVITLLNAFEKSPYSIRIAGTGPLESLVTATAEKSNNISYLGHLPREQIIFELQQCTALIFASEWQETFGLVIIEALALGTPVLAAKVGAAASIIQTGINGLTFNPGNVEDLRNCISKWSQLPATEQALYRERARHDWEKNYTPAQNLQILESIYQEVKG